jgi:hypothetical protein
MGIPILLLVAGFRMPGYISSAMAVPLFGALTRGSIGTIPETIKIENTQRYREVLWLGDLDSNQD